MQVVAGGLRAIDARQILLIKGVLDAMCSMSWNLESGDKDQLTIHWDVTAPKTSPITQNVHISRLLGRNKVQRDRISTGEVIDGEHPDAFRCEDLTH